MLAAALASANRINQTQRTLRSLTAANEVDGSLAETAIAVNVETRAAARPICTSQSISLD
jgi:hypothetical protein